MSDEKKPEFDYPDEMEWHIETALTLTEQDKDIIKNLIEEYHKLSELQDEVLDKIKKRREQSK